MTGPVHPTLRAARFEVGALRLLLAPSGCAADADADVVARAVQRLDHLAALLDGTEEARPLTQTWMCENGDGGALTLSVAELMEQHPGREADVFATCERTLAHGSVRHVTVDGADVILVCTDRAALTAQLDRFADCNLELMEREQIQWPAQN